MTIELQSMSMDGDAFRHWRKRHKLSQKDAARALGLKPRIIQYYEKGERDGKTVEIPLSVRLACYAIESGIGDFDGKDGSRFKLRVKKSKEGKEPKDAVRDGDDD